METNTENIAVALVPVDAVPRHLRRYFPCCMKPYWRVRGYIVRKMLGLPYWMELLIYGLLWIAIMLLASWLPS